MEAAMPAQAPANADSLRMFVAGGAAGAIARTCSAPLDRIKLLFQVQAVASSSGISPTAYTGVLQAAAKIFREEGLLAFWKGNAANIIRIFPYSAAQLAANDTYKRVLVGQNKSEITVPQRLLSGALAGTTATGLTHPLDTVRLRLALPNHPYKGVVHAGWTIIRMEGPLALYKGLVPALVGIAPYAAINFASYDLLKAWFYKGSRPQHPLPNLLLGGAAGTLAATVCYPLDTIRRRMQMKTQVYKGQLHAITTIWATEGWRGFYRGWFANALKVIPQNAIRFVTYEFLKSKLGVHKTKTDT